MTEAKPIHEDEEILEFLTQHDPKPIASAGTIPQGHKGPYHPSTEEFVQGTQSVSEAAAQLTEARAKVAQKRARNIFPDDKKDG